jgi:hypothetical protein
VDAHPDGGISDGSVRIWKSDSGTVEGSRESNNSTGEDVSVLWKSLVGSATSAFRSQLPDSSLTCMLISILEEPGNRLSDADKKARKRELIFKAYPERYKNTLKHARKFILQAYPLATSQPLCKHDRDRLKDYVRTVLTKAIPWYEEQIVGQWDRNIFDQFDPSRQVPPTLSVESRTLYITILSILKDSDILLTPEEVCDTIRTESLEVCQPYYLAYLFTQKSQTE